MRIYCDVLGRTAQERKQTKKFESQKNDRPHFGNHRIMGIL